MDSIAALISGLKLREDEKRSVKTNPITTDSVDQRVMLAGRILSRCRYPHERIAGVFEKVWSFSGSIEYAILPNNTFLAHFENPLDKERVLEREPWNFDKLEQHLVVLCDPKDGMRCEDLVFEKTQFWVHVYGVPLTRMTEDTAIKIGDDMGEFVEFDRTKRRGTMGDFMRIRDAG